jgi:Helix-turn-helix domain
VKGIERDLIENQKGFGMKREDRTSDSPLVARVSRVTYFDNVRDVAEPDGTWDMVFRHRLGQVQVLQTGQHDRPIELDYEAGDSYFAIAFKPDVFMPHLPGSAMVWQGVFHPLANKSHFWIGAERLEIPAFDNAEHLVARLSRRGLIARDRVVGRAVQGSLRRLDDRTLQRHCAHVTGLTGKALQQILRANRAVKLLQLGDRISAVAAELGYTDQSHLTRSLQRIIGHTPGEINRCAPKSTPASR